MYSIALFLDHSQVSETREWDNKLIEARTNSFSLCMQVRSNMNIVVAGLNDLN